MDCGAHCTATAKHFDRARGVADRARYQREGPIPTTSAILALFRRFGIRDRDLLDIGGGIGVIGTELLPEGMRHATLIEASPGYVEVAREMVTEVARAEDRFSATVADFAALDPTPAADLVALDRVVCCYPDYPGLLRSVAEGTRAALAMSYPRDRWLVRALFALDNLLRRLKRNPFRAFVHPPEGMAAVLGAAGLRRTRTERTFAWSIELWERSDPPS